MPLIKAVAFDKMNDIDLTIFGIDDDEEGMAKKIPSVESLPPLPPQPIAPPANCIKAQVPALNKESVSSLEDIRSIWLSARSPQEIAVQAATMPFGVWMDYVIKMTPKQVDIKGQIDMRAAFVNLGPPPKRPS